jgi:glycosyltransferase involved in cell wall biosynthesis
MSVSLSVIVPALNESAALPALLDEIARVCGECTGGSWEAIVVDDGSTDGSFELMEQLVAADPHLRAVRLRRNFGKSAALSVGFAQSSGERIVTIDGDGQDDPADIPRLLAALDDGADLVSGWKRNRRDPLSRRLASRVFNWVTARLTGLRMHDMNCGLKAYRGECARSLEVYGELHRYIPVLADQQGWRVAEIPVNHRPRRHGRSRFGVERYLRGPFDLLAVVFIGRYQYRPLHLFGGLGVGLTMIGAVIELYLFAEKLAGNAIGGRPLLFLGLLLIVVGVQLLTFGLLAQMVVLNRRKISGSVEPAQIERVLGGEAPSPEELSGGSGLSATETLPPA